MSALPQIRLGPLRELLIGDRPSCPGQERVSSMSSPSPLVASRDLSASHRIHWIMEVSANELPQDFSRISRAVWSCAHGGVATRLAAVSWSELLDHSCALVADSRTNMGTRCRRYRLAKVAELKARATSSLITVVALSHDNKYI